MKVIQGKRYRELRCSYCRKLICYEYIIAGRVAYECPRCKKITTFEFQALNATDIIRKEQLEVKKKKGR